MNIFKSTAAYRDRVRQSFRLLPAALCCGVFLAGFTPSVALAKAIPPPSGFDNAQISIHGNGIEPNSVVTLSTGASQTLSAKADDKGYFSFNNLGYKAAQNLTFQLTLPKRSRGLVQGHPTRLLIDYIPKKSRVTITGNIGKAGHILVGAKNTSDYKSYIAGEDGYISMVSHIRGGLIDGPNEVRASVITANEVCCPRMVIPAPPVYLTISSAPVNRPVVREASYDITPYEKKRVAKAKRSGMAKIPAINPPSFNASVYGNAETTPTQTSQPANTAPAKKPATTPTPLYINPRAVPDSKNGDSPDNSKKSIPYINQGFVPSEIIRTSTGVSAYAYDYDNTYDGSWKHMTDQMRQAIAAVHVMITTYFDGANFETALRKINMAHVTTLKDYTTSETICRFGTLIRTIGKADSEIAANKMSFQTILASLQNQRMGTMYSSPATGVNTHIKEFVDKYCNVVDNNTFLKGYCVGGGDLLYNRDVDYTRVYDHPWTIYDMTGNTLALFKNLTFMPPVFIENEDDIQSIDGTKIEMRRSLNALRSVANNTYASLIAQKVKSSIGECDGPDAKVPRCFMLNVLRQLGLSRKDAMKITTDLGYYEKDDTKAIAPEPSYYAQMEILTKKVFQDPAFFTNLYDSPQNVDRQKVAITAITLQQDRDFLESLRRREMLLSALLEAKLLEAGFAANATITATNRPD